MRIKSLVIYLLLFVLLFSGCTKTADANAPSIPIPPSNLDEELSLQLETEHFEFYCSETDKKCLEDMAAEIEGNYKRLTSDLDVTLNYKPKVNIYPNLKAFHEAINQPNSPDWGVGTAWGKDLRMVSPLNPGPVHTYESIKSVLLHEFVHVLQINIVDNPQDLPKWLWEGMAAYEARQMSPIAKRSMKVAGLNKKSPSLNTLKQDFYTVNNAYYYGYSIIDFLIAQFGNEKMLEVLKDYDNMEKILGISIDEFEKKWQEFIIEKY